MARGEHPRHAHVPLMVRGRYLCRRGQKVPPRDPLRRGGEEPLRLQHRAAYLLHTPGQQGNAAAAGQHLGVPGCGWTPLAEVRPLLDRASGGVGLRFPVPDRRAPKGRRGPAHGNPGDGAVDVAARLPDCSGARRPRCLPRRQQLRRCLPPPRRRNAPPGGCAVGGRAVRDVLGTLQPLRDRTGNRCEGRRGAKELRAHALPQLPVRQGTGAAGAGAFARPARHPRPLPRPGRPVLHALGASPGAPPGSQGAQTPPRTGRAYQVPPRDPPPRR
mmetsp:Transcript_65483/g.156215  ORF Transcript_65483/g.156215 Transcript_65483/m.156215 type:complete len:273 (-) Transcript_65483:45-863(-)